jgi:hypothetical protein
VEFDKKSNRSLFEMFGEVPAERDDVFRLEPAQRLGLDLTDALTSDPHDTAYFFERDSTLIGHVENTCRRFGFGIGVGFDDVVETSDPRTRPPFVDSAFEAVRTHFGRWRAFHYDRLRLGNLGLVIQRKVNAAVRVPVHAGGLKYTSATKDLLVLAKGVSGTLAREFGYEPRNWSET